MTSQTLRSSLLTLSLAAAFGISSDAQSRMTYPQAKKVDQVDDYHGVKVADPYRWLEDPDSADSRAWIEAENKITFHYLEQIPQRTAIRERLTRLWNYERFGVPSKEGGRYFYSKNDGLQNQSVLYTVKSLSDEPRVLLDPNKLSEDGTVALSGLAVSDNGKLMAYGVSASGSDWQEWRVRDVDTGKDQSDLIKWVKFSSASWTKDGAGFFYSRYDEPNEKTKMEQANYYQKLFYHRLGTKQSDDVLVYERRDQKDWLFNGGVSDDGTLPADSRFGRDRQQKSILLQGSDEGEFQGCRTDQQARGELRLHRQRRADLLPADEPGCSTGTHRGHRHPEARARKLERAGASIGRDPRKRELLSATV